MNKLLFAIMLMLALACVGAAADEVAPLGMPNWAIGGSAFSAYTLGVENGNGLNNIGLLIRTWGKVTYVDDIDPVGEFFYIDDGSGLLDGSGYVGIRVSCTNLLPPNEITPPVLGEYTAVTGISSTIVISDLVRPLLRPRDQNDVQSVF
jgi:hypothetical protein